MSKKTLSYGFFWVILALAMFAAAPRVLACTSGCPVIPEVPNVPTIHVPTAPHIIKPAPTPVIKPIIIKPSSSTVVEQSVSQETNVKVEVKTSNNGNNHHNNHNDHHKGDNDHKKIVKVVKIVKELPVTGPSILGLAGLVILAILIAVGIKKSYQVKSAK